MQSKKAPQKSRLFGTKTIKTFRKLVFLKINLAKNVDFFLEYLKNRRVKFLPLANGVTTAHRG